MEQDPGLITKRWDQAYQAGKYAGEGAIPFVGDILSTIETKGLHGGEGLYVGCGNGRNYIPLIDKGLNLTGLDISPEALRQIAAQRPNYASKLVYADFLDYRPPNPLDYLISIQVFQHGNQAEAAKYFRKTADLLRPGGLLFLRVNSTATQIFHPHEVTEVSPENGITISYAEGPKAGLSIHFYTEQELERLTAGSFEPVTTPKEAVIDREPPQTGQWVQWEGIWRRSA